MFFCVLIAICSASCVQQKESCLDSFFEKSFNTSNSLYTCCPCMGHCNKCLNENVCVECEERHGLFTQDDGSSKCSQCSHKHCVVCSERTFGLKVEEQCFRCVEGFKINENGNCEYEGDGGYEQILLFDILMGICGLFYVVILAFKQMNRKYDPLISNESTLTKEE